MLPKPVIPRLSPLLMLLLLVLLSSACAANQTPVTPSATPYATLTPTPSGGGSGRVVFVQYPLASDPQQDAEIYLLDLPTRALIQLTDNQVYDGSPLLTPDGKHLLYYSNAGSGGLYLMALDTRTSRQISENHLGQLGFDLSPDGSLILYVAEEEGDRGIYLMNINGQNQRRLTPVGDIREDGMWVETVISEWGARFDKDGSRIFFLSNEFADTQLYSILLDGSQRYQITSELEDCNLSDISPDGVHLLFTHDLHGDFEVFLVNREGGLVRRITDNHDNDTRPLFTPDGRHLLFVSDRDGNQDIYLSDLDGLDVRQLTQYAGDNLPLSFSPNTSQLLFYSNREDGKWYLYQMDLNSLAVEPLVYVGDIAEPAFFLP